jgi:hypothetical protein
MFVGSRENLPDGGGKWSAPLLSHQTNSLGSFPIANSCPEAATG